MSSFWAECCKHEHNPDAYFCKFPSCIDSYFESGFHERVGPISRIVSDVSDRSNMFVDKLYRSESRHDAKLRKYVASRRPAHLWVSQADVPHVFIDRGRQYVGLLRPKNTWTGCSASRPPAAACGSYIDARMHARTQAAAAVVGIAAPAARWAVLGARVDKLTRSGA